MNIEIGRKYRFVRDVELVKSTNSSFRDDSKKIDGKIVTAIKMGTDKFVTITSQQYGCTTDWRLAPMHYGFLRPIADLPDELFEL